MQTTDTPQVKETNDNKKKARAQKGDRIFEVNHKQEQVCDFTGRTEKEDGVIFSTGTLNIGRQAIKILSSQLAEWERQQREG